jgi:hypothetical protein
MTARGRISKFPEKKISQTGLPYLRFQIDVPTPQGRWDTRVYCTIFGDMADLWEQKLTVDMTVHCEGSPSASAWANKMGKPTGGLSLIVRKLFVVPESQQPQVQQPAPAPVMPNVKESEIDLDEIPF